MHRLCTGRQKPKHPSPPEFYITDLYRAAGVGPQATLNPQPGDPPQQGLAQDASIDLVQAPFGGLRGEAQRDG